MTLINSQKMMEQSNFNEKKAKSYSKIEDSDTSNDDIKQNKRKKATQAQLDWFCQQMAIIRDKSRCYDMF